MQTSRQQSLASSAPTATNSFEELLFFDTFSHSDPENNFDLVQFPTPVVIDSIKIVPLGQPIEAKIPGNVRLGATNPSNCELEFFINDLSKHDAHTFTDLGKFYCSEKDTDFAPPLQIQTDGLLLRGSYRTLTLAIFGQVITFEEKHDEDQAAVILSPPAQTPASPVGEERDATFSSNNNLTRSLEQELLFNRPQVGIDLYEQASVKSDDTLRDIRNIPEHGGADLIEDVSVNHVNSSVSKFKDFVDEVSVDGGRASCLNEKRSNEGFVGDDDSYTRHTKVNDEKDTIDEENSNLKCDDADENDCKQWNFDIKNYRPEPLTYFANPSLTLQERSILSEHKLKLGDSTYCDAIENELKRLRDAFDRLNCSDGSKSEDWVALIEALTNDIANLSLSQFLDDEGVLNCLIQEVCYGLDFDLALKQKLTAFKVRHLRAGLKLATILFHCGETAVRTLLKYSVPYKVLLLYEKEQMSLPLKLLLFRCISVACDSISSLEHLISYKYTWSDSSMTLQKLRQIHRDKLDSKTSNDNHEGHQVFESVDDGSETENSNIAEDPKILTDEDDEPPVSTCYQYMLRLLLSKPKTRITMALGSIFKKIRLYLNFSKLFDISKIGCNEYDESEFEHQTKLRNTLKPMQDIIILMEDGCLNITQPVRHLPAKVQFQVRPYHGDPYIAVFKWIKHFDIFGCINMVLGHFQETSVCNSEDSVRLQCLCVEFLQSILESPRGPHLLLSEDCYLEITSILQMLIRKQPPKKAHHLRLDAIDNYAKAAIIKGETLLSKRCHDFALRMIYSLKVYTCIDKMFNFHRDLMTNDGLSSINDPESILHELLIISDHPYGLAALLKHFSYIGNLDCLLRFLEMPEYHKQLEFVKEISIDYSLELIGTFVKLNNNVLEIAEEYLETFVDLSKSKDKNLSTRIKLLLPWLTPFDVEHPLPLITYTEDTFKQLVKVIRKSIPNCSIPFAKGLNFDLPPQMITAVRILRQLCVPPQVETYLTDIFDNYSSIRFVEKFNKASSSMPFVDSFPHHQNFNLSWNVNNQLSKNQSIDTNLSEDFISDHQNQITQTFKLFQPYDDEIVGELKFHFGIMQTIEQGGLKRLLNTLRELTGNYPKPIYQSAALCGMRGRIVLSYIDSVVILLHSIVCHLIDARGSDFKDISVIPVVLEVYSLLCFTPKPTLQRTNDQQNEFVEFEGCDIQALQRSITLESDNYRQAQQTKNMILSILMSYTQLCLSVSESEEKVISKSLWTKMLNEVIDFSISAPVFIHHGLEVLTKIFPSPLPNSSMMDSIDQEQLFRSINHRKLWSAHLHPLHQSIEQMISHLSICHHKSIRNFLSYLCNQLCDLSSTAACMVAKIIIDTMVAFGSKLHNISGNGIPSDTEQQQSNQQKNAPSIDEKLIPIWMGSVEVLQYVMKMLLNLTSNLITNKAFETALANYLHVVSKKDEKTTTCLKNALNLIEESQIKHTADENYTSSVHRSNSNNVSSPTTKLFEDMINFANTLKDNPIYDAPPTDDFVKINLMELSRKTSDRFSISSGLKKSYRLKVLIDFTSNIHRSAEAKRFDYTLDQSTSSAASKRSFAPPPPARSRVRPPDPFRTDPSASSSSSSTLSFRSRTHSSNSSRPASIHVDDFMSNYHVRMRSQRKFPASSNSRFRY